MKAFLVCALAAISVAVPTTLVTLDNANEMVGMTKFEAKMVAMSKFGMYELKFTPEDIKDFIRILHPFERYEESNENVVLMDEFPYVPVLTLPVHNSTVLLSNLLLEEKFNPDLITVDFVGDYQSFRILDLSLNATFEWKVNNTRVGGRAKVTVPQVWIHQNIEIACSHEQPSILVWEGRVNLYTTDISITTSVTDKSFVDELAAELHRSEILRKYIGNAVQHQLSSAIGKLHWKTQERMREDCLNCHGMRYSKDLLEVLVKGEPKCIANLPTYMIDPLADENGSPEELTAIAAEAIKRAVNASHVAARPSADERLEAQGLPSVQQGRLDDIASLRPRFDWREKFRHKKRSGFIEESENTHPWLNKLGKMWMYVRGVDPNANAAAGAVENAAKEAGKKEEKFATSNMPPAVDAHDVVKNIMGR